MVLFGLMSLGWALVDVGMFSLGWEVLRGSWSRVFGAGFCVGVCGVFSFKGPERGEKRFPVLRAPNREFPGTDTARLGFAHDAPSVALFGGALSKFISF